MWKFKTDRMGKTATAVQRRLKTLGLIMVDLDSPTRRAEFGYNYLEWKED